MADAVGDVSATTGHEADKREDKSDEVRDDQGSLVVGIDVGSGGDGDGGTGALGIAGCEKGG